MAKTVKKVNKYFSSGITGLPVQTVSMFAKESDEWRQANMDFFDYASQSQQHDKVKDLRKFKSLSPEYKASDYMYARLQVGKDDEDDDTEEIMHFPIMASPINTIMGEYVKRPLNYYCITNSARARNEYYRVKTERLKAYAIAQIQQRIMQQLVQEGKNPKAEDFGQQVQAKMPQDIQDEMNKDYVDILEQISQKILINLWKTESLDMEFLDGFKYATVTAKEFYHIYSVGNRTKIKCISPLDVFYHKSPNSRWISESQYAGFRMYMTASSLIDMYRPVLTVKDVDSIEDLIAPDARQHKGRSYYRTDVFATHQGATFNTLNNDDIENMVDQYHQTGYQGYYMNSFGLIKVVQAYWKSFKKVGVLEYYDEHDQPQEAIVDETYEVDKTIGQDITWGYLNQIYQGTKIGDEIYVDIRPYKHQWFDEDDLDYCPLPIEGVCYNDMHMSPTSLVDLMVGWNELYNIVAAELKKDMRKAIGKVMFMSYDNLPKIPGFTKEKWLYWVREFGIAWVGNNKNQNGNFSHYSAQDMSFAEQMMAKMNILDRLKVNCDAFGGFSQSRLANSSNVDTAKQSQQDIVMSVNQTEYWYFKHSKLVERVLNHAVNIEKSLLKDSRYLRNMLDDMDLAYIELEDVDLPNEKVQVFVTNSADALAQKESLRQLIQPAVQNGADPVDMANILLATTQSEIRNTLDTLRQQRKEREQAEQQQKQGEIDNIKKIADDKLAWDKEKLYATLASEERQEVIRTFGHQEDNTKDVDQNGEPDMLEINAQMYDQQMQNNKLLNDRLKIVNENSKHKGDQKLKNRELDIKNRALDVDLQNQKNDLQIARTQARNKPAAK